MSKAIPEIMEREKTAKHLEQNSERIVDNWVQAVADDEAIPSADRLTMKVLRDHFPEMLQELIQEIREKKHGGTNGHSRDIGRAHGKARWRHGYRLDEALRELARIREMILTEIVALRKEKSISPDTSDSISQTARAFFDTIVAESVDQFVKAQDAEIVLRSSQLQHAYEQLQAATEQLRAISQSRLRMLRTVLHELRNALNGVGLAAVALRDEYDPAQRTELNSALTVNAKRLQKVLDRLQSFSRILAGEVRPAFETVRLLDFLQDLESEYRPCAEAKGLRFECRNSVPFESVTSDPKLLRLVASELLDNAVAFTNEGLVLLELLVSDPDRWVLSVTDSGVGLDAQQIKHVFSEFHSNLDQPGVRLGLVIAKHVAHLIAGELTVHSAAGEGSRFELNAPRE
ncbi:MAG TPA: sensor histidine kinase [Chthoniobacter sp.]|nr:sensor histidine kinase [Chthoniobacter sp.]